MSVPIEVHKSLLNDFKNLANNFQNNSETFGEIIQFIQNIVEEIKDTNPELALRMMNKVEDIITRNQKGINKSSE